jgi:hypothetical protein
MMPQVVFIERETGREGREGEKGEITYYLMPYGLCFEREREGESRGNNLFLKYLARVSSLRERALGRRERKEKDVLICSPIRKPFRNTLGNFKSGRPNGKKHTQSAETASKELLHRKVTNVKFGHWHWHLHWHYHFPFFCLYFLFIFAIYLLNLIFSSTIIKSAVHRIASLTILIKSAILIK